MDTPSDADLVSAFPGLYGTKFAVTSPVDRRYNCIAWAAGDQRRWWEPDPMGLYYWPAPAPREYNLAAYQSVFEALGYSAVDAAPQHAARPNSVALFAKGAQPTHAARQLSETVWTSKLGQSVDISHELHGVTGATYGAPAVFLAKLAV